jgi:branched-chain amino acid transport system ATP-binding protein
MALSSIPSSLVELSKVRKNFGGLTAVNDVTLDIRETDIMGLIGPNGAGKTTLFNLIAGMDFATSGTICFRGQDVTRLKPDRRCHLGIARTFQIPKPFLQMSVFENVQVAMLFGNAREKLNLKHDVDRILVEMGLERWSRSEASSLPLGGRKKLEVARALATKPKVILLDEVMGGLRAGEIDSMMDVIRRTRQSGVTIVMIEHVMRAVMDLADRIVVLHHGSLIADGTPLEVTRNQTVIDAYLGNSAYAAS